MVKCALCLLLSLGKKKKKRVDSFIMRAKKDPNLKRKKKRLTAWPRVLGLDVDHARVLDVRRAAHRRDCSRGSRERRLEVHRLRGREQVVGDPIEFFFDFF